MWRRRVHSEFERGVPGAGLPGAWENLSTELGKLLHGCMETPHDLIGHFVHARLLCNTCH